MTTFTYSPTNAFYVFLKDAGLFVSFNGGRALLSNGSIASISNGQITLSASSTNYVYLDMVSGVVSKNTTGFAATEIYPMAIAVTDSISITSLTDVRPDAVSTATAQSAVGGLAASSTQVPAPSPLATSPVPSGQSVFMWIQDANGNYIPYGSLNETTSGPPTAPAGSVNYSWRTWWDDSGVAGTAIRNSLFSIEHTLGHGGVTNQASLHERAFSARITNADAAFQQITQMITNYNEAELTGAPHFNGHAGGESDVSVIRASLGDSRSGNDGSFPSIIAAFSAGIVRDNAGALVSTSSGTWANYHAYVISTAGGTLTGSQAFVNFNSSGAGNTGGITGAGVYYAGFQAIAPGSRFPNNYGLTINSFGTNAADYNILSSGVNSAGTASGFNAFVGPTSLGQQIHAASSYQLDCLGAIKVKAGAGVSLIDLFGSTSGHAGISVAAAAGTPNTMQLPTTTASATTSGVSQAVVSDGGSPQQLSYQWHAPVMNASGTVQTAAKVVIGSGSLVSGTPSTLAVTLTGNAVFTNSGSYVVTVTNNTTATNGLKITQASGSSFTITGPNTVTDTVSYVAAGN